MDQRTSWAVKQVMRIAEDLRVRSEDVRARAEELMEVAERLRDDVPIVWVPPVGTDEYPPEAWYVAVLHDLLGTGINGGWYATNGHTGIDLNVDRWPWGDVDRGAPVWAMTNGIVVSRGSSGGWLGSVVVQHDYDGGYLYARYAHLDEDRIPVDVGETVTAGDSIGYLGDYQRGDGGDHLHFDMAIDAFEWNWWLTPKVRWVDPLIVMRERLGAELVERMVGRGDG